MEVLYGTSAFVLIHVPVIGRRASNSRPPAATFDVPQWYCLSSACAVFVRMFCVLRMSHRIHASSESFDLIHMIVLLE